jgi:hypothetical protein
VTGSYRDTISLSHVIFGRGLNNRFAVIRHQLVGNLGSGSEQIDLIFSMMIDTSHMEY